MPTITDDPPAYVRNDMRALRTALTRDLPAKRNDNLLIATWNIRSFSSLTQKWTATGNDSPKRDLRGLLAIAEIVSRFDVVAIQEVKGNLVAIREMIRYLGGEWGFLMTDVNYDDEGNDERYAFVFDGSRLRASGLAAELVVPPEWLDDPTQIALRRQFVRPPYAVSFASGDQAVILVTVHVDYGEEEEDRIPELQGFADYMGYWAGRSNRIHHNLLVLGDFNVDRQGSPGWDALISSGLEIPRDLVPYPRTVFADPGEPESDKFYDQIAWFERGRRRRLTLQYSQAGSFDFLPHVYTNTQLSVRQISYRISDHYPLWVEFGL